MQNEFLSIVDEHDRIIGAKPRHVIHALRFRHRAVHILVFNCQNQLFLQKRSMKKDLNAGLWDTSAAGHVDSGESYDASAHREAYEELGIDTKGQLELLFKIPACEATGMEFIQVYRCSHDGPFTLDTDEIEEGRWFPIETVSARVQADDPTLTESFKVLWHLYSRL